MQIKIKSKRNPTARRRDPGPIAKATHQGLTRLYTDATKTFLRHVVLEGVIRVDTGMSAASLLPLARVVRLVTEIRAGINPKTGPRKGLTTIGGSYRPESYKSIQSGEQLGQSAYTLDFGSLARPVFIFQFKIVVFQYLVHELGLVPGSGPWRSLESGKLVFENFISENFEKYLPNVSRYLIEGRITS